MKNISWNTSLLFAAFFLAACESKPVAVAPATQQPGGGPLTPTEIRTAEEVSQEPTDEEVQDITFGKGHLKCTAAATGDPMDDTKNQGLILWTHMQGSCNDGAYSFRIRSWGPVIRFSSEEVKIKCYGPGMESQDNWVGGYYGFRAAAGLVAGASVGRYAQRGMKRCVVLSHTDLDEGQWSLGFELGYGRLQIMKGNNPNPEPSPEPTPTPTPTPEPTDGPIEPPIP